MPLPAEIPTFDAPEKYGQYALNVEGHAPEKAQEARRQAVKLRATRDGAKSDVERECLETIFQGVGVKCSVVLLKGAADADYPILMVDAEAGDGLDAAKATLDKFLYKELPACA